MNRTKEYSFVLSTMPPLHARSRLLELGVFYGSSLKETVTISSFPFYRSGGPKRTGSDQLKWKGPERTHTFYAPQLSEFPRFGRLEQEN